MASERGLQSDRALAPRRWGTESPVVLHGQSPSQLSPGPQQIDDHGPDGRCQAVLVCDQLVECRTLPAYFRPGFSHDVVTTLRADNCGTRALDAIPAVLSGPRSAEQRGAFRRTCSRSGSIAWISSVRSWVQIRSPRLFFSHRCFVALFGVLPDSIAKFSFRYL